ncbi:MAG: hypothetical protein A3F04_00815 [Candidatus Chisholmbacteria bacterium RIFCSPHIGHO2_12_FULL_49_9]|nr:MAG: hypothetical protein A3F04_00815 [Candidatus Chisholmbacteria bacterium RIFCSPHIGHO2_12_FULL_49_9]
MQVSVLQDKLVKGLSSVAYAVSSKPSLPILSNVLLTAKEGILQLAATDLSLGIQLRIGAKVKKEGAITVPAKVFGELVSSFPLAPVELSLEGESLRIQCGSYRARLSGIPAMEFPSLSQVSGTGEFSLPVSSFREAVERVVFAASSD